MRRRGRLTGWSKTRGGHPGESRSVAGVCGLHVCACGLHVCACGLHVSCMCAHARKCMCVHVGCMSAAYVRMHASACVCMWTACVCGHVLQRGSHSEGIVTITTVCLAAWQSPLHAYPHGNQVAPLVAVKRSYSATQGHRVSQFPWEMGGGWATGDDDYYTIADQQPSLVAMWGLTLSTEMVSGSFSVCTLFHRGQNSWTAMRAVRAAKQINT
jgi:hypothetical protein